MEGSKFLSYPLSFTSSADLWLDFPQEILPTAFAQSFEIELRKDVTYEEPAAYSNSSGLKTQTPQLCTEWGGRCNVPFANVEWCLAYTPGWREVSRAYLSSPSLKSLPAFWPHQWLVVQLYRAHKGTLHLARAELRILASKWGCPGHISAQPQTKANLAEIK